LIQFLCKYIYDGRKKTRKMFTNLIHFEVFKHLPKLPDKVAVSSSYMVLHYEFVIGKNDGVGNYLVGVNSDGKLFINEIEVTSWWNPFSDYQLVGIISVREGVNVELFKFDDTLIYGILGFDYDFENSADKLVPVKIGGLMIHRYRVQGDLILNIQGDDAYFEEINQRLRVAVEEILRRIVLQRIVAILEDLGLAVERQETRLRIRSLPRWLDRKKEYSLVEKLEKYIVSKLDVRDLGAKLVSNRVSYNPDQEPLVIINTFIGLGAFGEIYLPIVVECNFSDELINSYASSILRSLDIKKSWNIVRVGRHFVRYYGYPQRITISTKFPDNEDYIIEIRTGTFYVDSGKIYIYHPEHGEVQIEVREPLTVFFTSTRIDRTFEDRLNYYTLKLLNL